MSFPSVFRGSPLVDRLFEDLWRGAGSPASGAPTQFAPRIDVVESEAEYQVTVELPGLEEKDFHLDVHGDVLTVSGEKRVEQAGEDKGWRWSERSYGSFRRSIQLPSEVETDKASATFKSGVLTIVLPKVARARVRQIPVTSS
jgi:HSP20 family protein